MSDKVMAGGTPANPAALAVAEETGGGGPGIAELEINPMLVGQHGVLALDARIVTMGP
jgi:hypothetical protein